MLCPQKYVYVLDLFAKKYAMPTLPNTCISMPTEKIRNTQITFHNFIVIEYKSDGTQVVFNHLHKPKKSESESE